MTRRAYGFAVGLALAVGDRGLGRARTATTCRCAIPTVSPGLRISGCPAIVLLFYLADVVPRALIANRGFGNFRASVGAYTRERWTRSRITLVVDRAVQLLRRLRRLPQSQGIPAVRARRRAERLRLDEARPDAGVRPLPGRRAAHGARHRHLSAHPRLRRTSCSSCSCR